jgi:uncharacterized Fe-S cluster-containing protein
MTEIWKDIEGYEGLYQISTLGNIARNGKTRKNIVTKRGYVRFSLNKDNKAKFYLIHTLVAKTFIPNKKNKPFVNHINGIKTDNRVENLEWVSQKENIIHSFKNLGRKSKGTKIIKYDLYGNVIAKYDTIIEASKETNFSQEQISGSCIVANQGFVFKYNKEKK